MTHPTPEDMMEHLYGENSAAQKAAIESHLQSCAECRGQAAAWRSSIKFLDAWRLPAAAKAPAAAWLQRLSWAAAAAIMIGLGFVVGRTLPPDAAAIQVALRQEVAAQVATAMNTERAALASELRAKAGQAIGTETRKMLASFAEQLDERRQSDAEVFYTALQQIDVRHSREVDRLRKDIGTVAVVADARLENAQEQILELAKATPPKN